MKPFPEQLTDLKNWSTQLIRGTILLIWIGLLANISISSLRGDIAKTFLEDGFEFPSVIESDFGISSLSLSNDAGKKQNPTNTCPGAREIISKILFFETNPPPTLTYLDTISQDWDAYLIAGNGAGNCNTEDKRQFIKKIEDLNKTIEDRLRSIARDETNNSNLKIFDPSILPLEIRPVITAQNDKAEPPIEISDWIKREKTRIKQHDQSLALFNAFVLLSTLGAFGALIYLIRDYMSSSIKQSISTYLFRPVLGIFLAIAVFVVDILAHSVISKSSILELRYEPLYLLALAAGLMTERVYNVISDKVGDALDDYEKDKRNQSDGSQPSAVEQKATGDLPSPTDQNAPEKSQEGR